MLSFLISALATGFIVVFGLPFARRQLDNVPGFAKITANKAVQLVVVGAIVLLGLALFGMLAKRLKV